MKVRLSGLILALSLVPSISLAADRPPEDLHLVGDHWTAWNPPTPPPGVQVHIIERGDTLWDLASRFQGNPYLWPQIWEKNQYILDAHWIYPGDPLVVGIDVAPVEQLSGPADGTVAPGEEADPGEPIEGVETAAQAAGEPIPWGAESDIYCNGYIGDLGETFPYTIRGSEYEQLGPDPAVVFRRYGLAGSYHRMKTARYNLTVGDIIYLDGGRSRGMSPGQVFTAIQPGEVVIHPLSHQPIGRYYHYTGRVRVLSVQPDTAIAEIVQACDPILVGEPLRLYEPEPVPLGRPTAMRPVNYPASAEKLQSSPVIVFTQDELVSLGEDHVVHIEGGEDRGVTPGDIFTVYRINRDGLPPVILGEVAVLSVHRRTSLAKIIESRYPIFVGDRLEPK
jgi:LysM domain